MVSLVNSESARPVAARCFPDQVDFYRYENNPGHLHAAVPFRRLGGIVPNTKVPSLSEHTGDFGASLSGTKGDITCPKKKKSCRMISSD